LNYLASQLENVVWHRGYPRRWHAIGANFFDKQRQEEPAKQQVLLEFVRAQIRQRDESI
jgi:hypothetical protein